jgi:hypothetical protein
MKLHIEKKSAMIQWLAPSCGEARWGRNGDEVRRVATIES